MLRIEVEDTGPGIPKRSLETLFEAYDRGDPSLSHTIEGTGLGLSIAKRLAEAMGGRIEVES